MTTPGAVPCRTLGVRIRRVEGELLLGVEDRALQLNGPALLLYTAADGRRTLAEVAGVLAAEYGIDQDEALADSAEFLAELAEQGVVEWRDPA